MQRLKLYFLLIITISILSIQCDVEKKPLQEVKTKIVLMNPSLGYLKSFDELIHKKIIDLPGLKFTAVYYNKEDEKLSSIIFHADTIKDYQLEILNYRGDLDVDNIFKANSMSQIFYDLFKNHDAIIFLGGADFPPVIYKQKTRLTTEISTPQRHLVEMSFLFHLLGGSQNESHKAYLEEDKDYIIYGFCLGMQTMNVATGGNMYQDIPIDIYQIEYAEDVLELDGNMMHRNYWRNISKDPDLRSNSFHQIQFVPGQFFTEKMNQQPDFQPTVRSSHHQAVNKIGKGWEITATSLDGKVVEGLHHAQYPNVVGVQFHPEYSTLYNSEHPGYKFTPADTSLTSDYTVLEESGSLKFHHDFWGYFNSLFVE
jgi:putative glutamine amidotransferase